MKDLISVDKTAAFEKERAWLEMELTERTTISPNLDKLIFIGFTNRTNTGALATALGQAPVDPPVTRHIQPFKAIARQLMEQKGVHASTPLKFFRDTIEINSGTQLVKETVGPNPDNPAEWVDSMGILKKKGLDFEKMVFVPTFREPLDCAASWRRMWGWEWTDFPFDSFNKSLEFVLEKTKFAVSEGAIVVPYVHELLRDFDPNEVVGKMCEKMRLPFSPQIVQWDNPKTTSDDNVDWYFSGHLVKYDQPPDKWVQGSLAVSHGGRGGLVWRPVKDEFTSQDQVDFVKDRIGPALEIHARFVESTKKLLNLT